MNNQNNKNRDIQTKQIYVEEFVELDNNTPLDTNNKLYNVGQELYFNGKIIVEGSGGASKWQSSGNYIHPAENEDVLIGGTTKTDATAKLQVLGKLNATSGHITHVESDTVEFREHDPANTNNKLYVTSEGILSYDGHAVSTGGQGDGLQYEPLNIDYVTHGDYGASQQLLLSEDFTTNDVRVVISESGFMIISYRTGTDSDKLFIYEQQGDNSWVETDQSPYTIADWRSTSGAVVAVDNNMIAVGETSVNNLSNEASRVSLYVWETDTKIIVRQATTTIGSGSNTNYGVSNISLKSNVLATDMAFLDGSGGGTRTLRRNAWRFNGTDTLTLLPGAWNNSVEGNLDQTYNSAYYSNLQCFTITGKDYIMHSYYVISPANRLEIDIYEIDGVTIDFIEAILINNSNFYPAQALAQYTQIYVDTTTPDQKYMFVAIGGTNHPSGSSQGGPDSQIRCYRWEGSGFVHKNDVDFSDYIVGYSGALRLHAGDIQRPMKTFLSGDDRLAFVGADAVVSQTVSQVLVYAPDKNNDGVIFGDAVQTFFPANTRTAFLAGSPSMQTLLYTDAVGNTSDASNFLAIQSRLPDGTTTKEFKYVDANLKVNDLRIKDEGLFKLPLNTAGGIASRVDLEDGIMTFDKTQGVLKLRYQNQWSTWAPVSGFNSANFSGYIPNSGDLSLTGQLLKTEAIQMIQGIPPQTNNRLYVHEDTLYFDTVAIGGSSGVGVNNETFKGTLKELGGTLHLLNADDNGIWHFIPDGTSGTPNRISIPALSTVPPGWKITFKITGGFSKEALLLLSSIDDGTNPLLNPYSSEFGVITVNFGDDFNGCLLNDAQPGSWVEYEVYETETTKYWIGRLLNLGLGDDSLNSVRWITYDWSP